MTPDDEGRLRGTRANVTMWPLSSLGIARTLATTYFPEGLPPQYLRRWRA